MPLSWPTIALAGGIVLVAAVVQGAAGFGLNLVAAPLLTIVAPAAVPVPLVLVSSMFSVLTVLREHDRTDWHGVGWSAPGQVVGTAAGAVALALLPQRGLEVTIAGVVLISVLLSILTWRPQPTRPALLIAGLASGAFGTAAAIGGPPIALIYQHRGGPTVRATLGAYFALGAALSIGGFLIGRQIHPAQLVIAAVLLPFAVAGFLISGPLRSVFDRGYTRPALLVIATVSALVVLIR